MIPLRDTIPSATTPVVTLAIILLNVMAFLYEISLDPWSRNALIAELGVVPAHLQVSDLLTSMFLHGGWLHLIGNMWFLWIYGDNVEDVMGKGRFIVFYLLCGVAASLTHDWFNSTSRVPAIGASGAIAGVMGSYLIKFPHAKILAVVPIFIIATLIEVPAVLVLILWFVVQIFSGLGEVAYSQATASGTAWFAHIGGFVAGIALTPLLANHRRYRHREDLAW